MNRSLPRDLDDLEGLRAARWVRVSDDRQEDNYGPDAQRERQDRVIVRYGLIDTGLVWEPLGVSGWETDAKGIAKIEADPRYQEMLSRAGIDYDVLVVAYVSRGSRNTELQMKTKRILHQAGAVILACKERKISTEPGWGKEAGASEYYSEQLSIDISDGNAAKWRKHHDPPGWAPNGYRRAAEKPYILEIDPEVMPREAARLFALYALGHVSGDDLEDMKIAFHHGKKRDGRPMTREGIMDLLSNPIYRGEVSYLGKTEQRPDLRAVSDDLWYQVQDVMRAKAHGGGPRRTDRVYSVAGLLHCPDCNAHVGLDGGERRRVRHKSPCETWGPMRSTKRDPKGKRQERRKASTYSAPVESAFDQIKMDDATIAQIRAIRKSPAKMPDLDGRRIDREMDEVLIQVRKGTLDHLDAVARLDTLQKAKDAATERPVASHGPSPDEAEAMLRNFEGTWAKAGEKERSDLIHALVQRIDVRRTDIVGVTLTSSAYEHGFALALPAKVAMACPRGLEPPTSRSAT